MDILTPQQLGVGVGGGIEVKVWGLKLWYEKNMALGNRAMAVALDILNARSTFDREASSEALSSFAGADGGLRSLPRAWHANKSQKNSIFVRDIDAASG
jgi:hypothetical protein